MMDYSNRGILVMLQDLQRENYGKVGIYVDTLLLSDGDSMIACCVFDVAEEPHTVSFYSFEADETHKENFKRVRELINTTKNGKSGKEGYLQEAGKGREEV